MSPQCEVCGKANVFLTDIFDIPHCNACAKLAYDAHHAIALLANWSRMDFGRIIELAQGVDRQMERTREKSAINTKQVDPSCDNS